MTAVKVIDAKDFNYELLNSHSPFVIRGLVSDWPLVQASMQSDSACLDYLLSYYQGAPVVSFSGDGSALPRIARTSSVSAPRRTAPARAPPEKPPGPPPRAAGGSPRPRDSSTRTVRPSRASLC